MELSKLNSKQKVRLGLVVVAVLASLVLVFFAGQRYQRQQPSLSEIYLQEQITKYQQEIENWKSRFNTISIEKANLEQSVKALENQVTSIRDYYDKKVITVKSYSNPELEQFFADRYSN